MKNQKPRQMSLSQLSKAAIKISDDKFGVGKASIKVSREIWRYYIGSNEDKFSICAFDSDRNIYFQRTDEDPKALLSLLIKATEEYNPARFSKKYDLTF
jgi:hypothetical protein